jgi:predicted transcriptional regulator
VAAEAEEVAQVRDDIIAWILAGAGLAVAAFLYTGLASGQLEATGFAAGLLVFSLPFFAVSAFVLLKARAEGGELSALAREQRVLDAIRSRGKASFAELAQAAGIPEPEARLALQSLVGKNLFTGYINWKAGEVFSREAGDFASGKSCPNCGAPLGVAGKGIAKCAYCGTEIYG